MLAAGLGSWLWRRRACSVPGRAKAFQTSAGNAQGPPRAARGRVRLVMPRRTRMPALRAASAMASTGTPVSVAMGLIPTTMPGLLRQLRGTVIPEPRRDQLHRDAWALWRRRQYRAQQASQRWHAYADELP